MTDIPKRHALQVMLAATLGLAMAGLTPAAGWADETYPTRPITLLIGYAAGGQTDLVGRGVARVLSNELGVPVNVVNRPGSGGLVATQVLQRAQPDGYTVLLQGHSVINADPFLVAQADFKPDDFEYAGMITAFQLSLATQKDAPFDTIAEFVEWARDNPGFTYGSLSPLARLYMEEIAEAEGLQANILPLQGGGDMINALLGRQVVLAWSGGIHYRYPDELKSIATTTTYQRTTLILPKGTPRPILERLSDALATAQDDEDFKRVTDSADVPIFYMNLDEAAEEVRHSYAANMEIFEAAGIESR